MTLDSDIALVLDGVTLPVKGQVHSLGIFLHLLLLQNNQVLVTIISASYQADMSVASLSGEERSCYTYSCFGYISA